MLNIVNYNITSQLMVDKIEQLQKENDNLKNELIEVHKKLNTTNKIGNKIPYQIIISNQEGENEIIISNVDNEDLDNDGNLVNENRYKFDVHYDNRYCWRDRGFIVYSENDKITFFD